jgi:hypothetical protein
VGFDWAAGLGPPPPLLLAPYLYVRSWPAPPGALGPDPRHLKVTDGRERRGRRAGEVTDLISEQEPVSGAVVPAGETVHLDYPEPVVLSHSGLWRAGLLGDTNSADFPLGVTVVGYTF